jgi:hypothetical protein
MQKENLNIPFFKCWKSITHNQIQKILKFQKNVIGRLLFLFRINNSNDALFRKIIPYVLSGFSIIFIAYVIMNILTNYPPREIGISP